VADDLVVHLQRHRLPSRDLRPDPAPARLGRPIPVVYNPRVPDLTGPSDARNVPAPDVEPDRPLSAGLPKRDPRRRLAVVAAAACLLLAAGLMAALVGGREQPARSSRPRDQTVEKQPPRSPAPRRAALTAWEEAPADPGGRFDRALAEALASGDVGDDDVPGRTLRARARLALGQWRAAEEDLGRVASAPEARALQTRLHFLRALCSSPAGDRRRHAAAALAAARRARGTPLGKLLSEALVGPPPRTVAECKARVSPHAQGVAPGLVALIEGYLLWSSEPPAAASAFRRAAQAQGTFVHAHLALAQLRHQTLAGLVEVSAPLAELIVLLEAHPDHEAIHAGLAALGRYVLWRRLAGGRVSPYAARQITEETAPLLERAMGLLASTPAGSEGEALAVLNAAGASDARGHELVWLSSAAQLAGLHQAHPEDGHVARSLATVELLLATHSDQGLRHLRRAEGALRGLEGAEASRLRAHGRELAEERGWR
jgi:hypothetical protein